MNGPAMDAPDQANPDIHTITTPVLDLKLTLNSGQVFHWTAAGDWWTGLIGRQFCMLRQNGAELHIRGYADTESVARYLALDHPLETIAASFPDDAFSQASLAACEGLRIIRQPEWECLATFITSSMKQVAHIRQMSFALRAGYGDPVPGSAINAYPTPESLANAGGTALRTCGLGFRAENLAGAARVVADGKLDLTALHDLPTPEARAALCALPGVGVKVANCVLLFAYERLDAVPVDVWIDRIMRAMRGGRRATASQLQRYSERRLGPYAGYVQQYLFHHARVSKTLPSR